MTRGAYGPRYYLQQAAQMRRLADGAQTEAMRKAYLRLAANLIRLAEEGAARQEEDGKDSF